MKKMFFFAITVLFVMASCQQKVAETNVITNTENEVAIERLEVANWELAIRLAAYGYETESVTALIEAADIMVSIPTVASDLQKEEPVGVAPTEMKEEKSAITVDKLLADALEMTDDEALLARIETIKRRQALLAEMDGTRGAVGGAKVLNDIVYQEGEQMFFCDFYAHQVACVALVGDGDSDLDVFVYDQNMNIVTEDTGYDSDCLCTWTPAWTGRFYIKVVNRGNVYNRFSLATN